MKCTVYVVEVVKFYVQFRMVKGFQIFCVLLPNFSRISATFKNYPAAVLDMKLLNLISLLSFAEIVFENNFL